MKKHLCYVIICIKKLSCTTFGLDHRKRIVKNMNFKDDHKFVPYKVSSKVLLKLDTR